MANKKVVESIIEYIENNLDSQLNLDVIAKEAGYSKFHLNRVFSEHVGCTIYKYIQMRRLTVAAGKLVHTRESIIEIAYDAHYGSQQSFTFAFRQEYGYSPQEYRAMRIHTPKFNRFRLDNNLVILNPSTVKCGVIAA